MNAFLLATLLLSGATHSDIPNFQLVEDLVLGVDEEDENQFFSPTASFAVDAQGTVYVLDPGNFHVAVFDAEGNHVRNFGGKGKGPGEFAFPLGIGLDTEQRIVVFDILNRRVMRFTPQGELVFETKLPNNIQAVYGPAFCENGNILLGTVKTDAAYALSYDLSLYNSSMEIVAPLYNVGLPQNNGSGGSEDYWVDFLAGQFEVMSAGLPLSATVNAKTLVIAHSGAYEGRIIGQDGKVLGQFAGALPPKPFTPSAQEAFFGARWESFRGSPLADRMPHSVFEKALNKTKKPAVLPPLSALASYRDGFIAVANYDPANNRGRLEYFGIDGVLRASAPYKGPIDKVLGVGDALYCAGNDEAGDFIIKRFNLTWP